MTLDEIYHEYTAGSTGFAIAVETHFSISRNEIKRIAEKAHDATSFQSIFENDDWWMDEHNK